MKQNKNYWSALLVKTSGIGIFTFALFKLPQALNAIIQFTSMLWLRSELGEIEGDSEALVTNAIHASAAQSIGNLLAFVILLLTARWVFSYPKILRDWFRKTDDAFCVIEESACITETESGSSEG